MPVVAIKNPAAPVDDGLGGAIQPDGSYLVGRQLIEQLGDGDLKRGRKMLRMMMSDLRDRKPIRGPVAKPAAVRIATEPDEAALLELLLLDLKENARDVAPIDEGRILAHIRVGTRKAGGIVGVIDGPEKMPVAVTCIIPAQWWFSKGYYLWELFTFVHPDHRRSGHADALIEFGQWASDEWSRSAGFRIYLMSGVLSTSRTREKIRLYKKRNNYLGAVFLYPHPPEVDV